jgi:hypothetical protein
MIGGLVASLACEEEMKLPAVFATLGRSTVPEVKVGLRMSQ